MGMAADFSNVGLGYQKFIPKQCGHCPNCETNLCSPLPNVGTCELLERNVDMLDIHENCPLIDE
ncbi:MAG: hypothetical protein PHC68_00455 [Syntrophorhabdaceae bacterium]|nr:hypothetical protein [Syntrophorhabdaceae bacterium]